MDDSFNAFKCLYVEQLLKLIRQQSDQIESQKSQINALIKSQQSLLESLRPSVCLGQSLLPPTMLLQSQSQSEPRSLSSETPKSQSGSETVENCRTMSETILKKELDESEAGSPELLMEEEPDAGAGAAAAVCSTSSAEDGDDLVEFAGRFKLARLELGFTQRDVGVCLGLANGGHEFSQTTLSRFEARNLSRRNMRKLRPLLQGWLDCVNREGREPLLARVAHYYRLQQQQQPTQISLPPAMGVSNKVDPQWPFQSAFLRQPREDTDENIEDQLQRRLNRKRSFSPHHVE